MEQIGIGVGLSAIDDDMDFAEDELHGFTDEQIAEVAVNYGPAAIEVPTGVELLAPDDGTSAPSPVNGVQPALVALVAESINSGPVPAASASVTASASSSSSVLVPPPVPDAPWANFVDPDEDGYVFSPDHGGIVCRIQLQKPKNRTTFTCYLHPGCQLLINSNRTPANSELYSFLFELPEATPDMGKDEKRDLRELHVALGKSRWVARTGS